ncbi:SAM domain-containing protein SAMSN-1b [Anableps anableps]
MNLFCFTLDGSTESIYEPVNSHTLKEVLPKYQCSSGPLRCKAEWGGSDPSISSGKHQTRTKAKEDSRRSCKPTVTLEDETFVCSENGVLTRHVQIKEPVSERARADLPAQHGEAVTESCETSHTTGRLKKLQKLVHVKNGHQIDGDKDTCTTKKHDCLAEGVRHNTTVLNCISLSRRTEKSSSEAAAASHPLQRQQDTRNSHEDPTEGGFWSPKIGRHRWKPFECPHTCQQTPHELCTHNGNISSLNWNSEWDRFESLIQELDRKQSDLCLSQMIRSLTDLQLSQNKGKQETVELKLQGREMETLSESDSKHISVSPEKTQAAIINRYMQNDEAAKRDASRRGTCTKGHSLESLYSLKSGESSSSGVTSGSNCSSNRDSLRLEDELTFTRQLGCRARVHTEFVPSLYDTESLTLKVGDVIDVIAKPPMGTWTGLLNGRIGNFKFIYVDMLTYTSGTTLHEVSQKSTVQEVLRRLSLEEYTSSLQLSGYQTVDDLMKLRESDLMELNVTDPEHRERLLAAVNSLQRLHSDSLVENEAGREPEKSSEDLKGDVSSRPRDSGCLVTSDSREDTDPHFLSEYAERPDIKV